MLLSNFLCSFAAATHMGRFLQHKEKGKNLSENEMWRRWCQVIVREGEREGLQIWSGETKKFFHHQLKKEKTVD